MPSHYSKATTLTPLEKQRRAARWSKEQWSRRQYPYHAPKHITMPWEKRSRIQQAGKQLNKIIPFLRRMNNLVPLVVEVREKENRMMKPDGFWDSMGFIAKQILKVPDYVRNAYWFKKQFSGLASLAGVPFK